MSRLKFMFVAGEPSGDLLAADLVRAIRAQTAERCDFEPVFFGAGGQHMREAGVEVVIDMTAHSVIGVSDVIRKLRTFRRMFLQLRDLAVERLPDVIVCVDFSGFNRRLGHAIREEVRSRGSGWFQAWSPRIVQYVSPQVWASRPGRALKMREDFDLVLAIFPFEPEWYAQHAPGLPVEFVGHPLMERYPEAERFAAAERELCEKSVLLLPGSRKAELKRHMPAISGAVRIIGSEFPGIQFKLVLPNARLAEVAKSIGVPPEAQLVIGNLKEELMGADLALASTGTVTMECALFGVPTIAFYKTSWSTYQIGRRIVSVKFLAMPNILAGEEVFPEFVQGDATADQIGKTAVALLRDRSRRDSIRQKLAKVTALLGGAGASERAARAILECRKVPTNSTNATN